MSLSLTSVVAAALHTPRILTALGPLLEEPLVVPHPYYRKILQWTRAFWTTYRTLPTPQDRLLWTATLAEAQQGGVQLAWGELDALPPVSWTAEYLVDTVGPYLQALATTNAVAQLNQLAPAIPPTALADVAQRVALLRPAALDGLLALAEPAQHVGLETWTEGLDTRRWPSGFPTIDRVLGGGWGEELVFFLADTGVGKSTALINCGVSAVLHGAKVLHITLELAARATLDRYYRRITESARAEYRRDREVTLDRIRHWLRYAKGHAHILYRPAYSLPPEAVGALVDQYRELYGGLDLLILDYLDLLVLPKGQTSDYATLGQLSHQIRALCTQYHLSVLSATQASRTSHQRGGMRLDWMGDSYRKSQAADVVLGLAQSAEEEAVQQGRLSLLKIREGAGRGVEVPVYINLDIMTIAELDHPNTQRLRALHQQRPVEPEEHTAA